MVTIPSSVIALDVGSKRIGVALASLVARLPRPLTTLTWEPGFFDELQRIIDTEHVSHIVVGLPRGLEGQSTQQTESVEAFVGELRQHIQLPMSYQDEALTSHHAEAELAQRGAPYQKGDVDALAATYILEDWLKEHPEVAT